MFNRKHKKIEELTEYKRSKQSNDRELEFQIKGECLLLVEIAKGLALLALDEDPQQRARQARTTRDTLILRAESIFRTLVWFTSPSTALTTKRADFVTAAGLLGRFEYETELTAAIDGPSNTPDASEPVLSGLTPGGSCRVEIRRTPREPAPIHWNAAESQDTV